MGPQLRRVRHGCCSQGARRSSKSTGTTSATSPARSRCERVPGYVAGATFARALGFNGAQVASSYAACASGVTALQVARGQILSGATDVALIIGADTTLKGFLKPNEGDRPDDTDWLRFKLVGATNPVYFGLNARRRMDLFGATQEDFARVKVKNSHTPCTTSWPASPRSTTSTM